MSRVLGIGAMTPIGLNAPEYAAAQRAGIQRLSEVPLGFGQGAAVTLGLVDNTCLALGDNGGRASASRRLLALAAPALREALDQAGCAEPPPLLLIGPPATAATLVDRGFLTALHDAVGGGFDRGASRHDLGGRSAGLAALVEGVSAADVGRPVVVGAVDSHLDVRRLLALQRDGRLAGEKPGDSRIPGEGAAFVVLAAGAGAGIEIAATGSGTEADDPGGGLTAALGWLGDGPPIGAVLTGFTGERVWAREWSIAAVRHARRFADGAAVEHPAIGIGDPGCALGPLQVALAAQRLTDGTLAGPVLCWCGGDDGERVALTIQKRGDG